ncbi:hypothetical protein EJB05_22282, partial [Eragrostis curvula]
MSSMLGVLRSQIPHVPHRFLSSRPVRVVRVSHVLPYRATNTSTAVLKLSFFDLLYVTMAPVQNVLFYKGPSLPPFPSIVNSFQSSLATTLAAFPPLSGKLMTQDDGPSSREVVIDCSPGAVSPGVKFVEAEYRGGTVDGMRRLAGDEEHDAEVFALLVPEVGPAGQLPAPVLAVQVTRPAAGDGTVAVGVSMHHSACDGRSFWRFMSAWATAAREPGHHLVQPIFDREQVIRDPRVQELTRKSKQRFATNAPVDAFPFPPADMARQRRRTFWLGAGEIQSLKQRLCRQGSGIIVEPLSTFVAVSSLVWTSIVRAKSTMDHADDDCYFLLSADIRRRLRPPVDENYFGNCVMGYLARATVADLSRDGDDGLVCAASAIQRAIREDLEDPMANLEHRLALRHGLPADRVTVMGSSKSNQFRPFETDFGWGAPSRVEMVSMTVMEEVVLRGAPDGGVQVSVALGRTHMEAMTSNFRQVSELV